MCPDSLGLSTNINSSTWCSSVYALLAMMCRLIIPNKQLNLYLHLSNLMYWSKEATEWKRKGNKAMMKQDHRYTPEIPELLYHLYNFVVSHGESIGVFRFLPTTHTHRNKSKQNMSTIFMCPAAFHVFILMFRLQCIWMNESRLFSSQEKKLDYPNWSPMPDKDGAGSGISGLYLWTRQKI